MSKKIWGIWAQDEKGLIGREGHLPWRLPAELQHFKKTTMGQTILMGRKTFDGMNQRILPGRETLILSRQEELFSDQVLQLSSRASVLDWYKDQFKDLYIIGGGQTFSLFQEDLQGLVRSVIHDTFEGDTWFPEVFPWSNFKKVAEDFHPADQENLYDFTVERFERKDMLDV